MKRHTIYLALGAAGLLLTAMFVSRQVLGQDQSQVQKQGAQQLQQQQLQAQPAVQQPPNGQVPQPQQIPPNGQLQKAPPQVNLSPGKNAGPAPPIAAPVPITTKEGKKGWKVVIPGNRPLATPAVMDGKVFVGGGFGSHEFYAFDAKSGKKLWLYRTGDDGPTAAVVQDGYIAFNTESCELEIITMEGRPVWKKWLGDPLMSMPAVDQGKVYMAYPNSKGDRRHYVACFDLKTGKEHWKQPIPGDIITAPVVDGGKLYVATLEGTLSCFQLADGKLAWKDKKNTTSSVTVWNGQCYFSRRTAEQIAQAGKQITIQSEALAIQPVTPTPTGAPAPVKDLPATKQQANYLDYSKRLELSKKEAGQKSYDAGVGFATAPADAKLAQGRMNLGQATVCGVWSYQGSRPFMYKGQLYSAMGDVIKCVDPRTEKLVWKKEIKAKDAKHPVVDATVTPPAIVNGKLFVGTTRGEILCLSADKGKVLWKATVGEPIVFQPAVADGRVFVSTSNGHLYCVETGDARDDGWLMWGGTAAHNGVRD
jgi:Ca-activated chloride channel family protein